MIGELALAVLGALAWIRTFFLQSQINELKRQMRAGIGDSREER